VRALRALAFDIDQLDQFAADRFGVNRTDLRGIELLGASRTTGPTALAAALHVTTAGVTSVIDRLERAGYARRRHDLHDRRKVVVAATDLLIRREQQVFGELLGGLEQLAQTYSDAELSIVQGFLERSRELVMSTHQGQSPAQPESEHDPTPCA
jgi:DNA-binding MarR family transcriptional regulator